MRLSKSAFSKYYGFTTHFRREEVMAEKKGGKEEDLNAIFQKAAGSQVIYNISQEYITTTTDKIRICMHSHMKNLEKRRAWITPLGIFLTILITFATTSFKQAVFSPETWQAFFLMFGAVSLVWLILSLSQIPKAEDEEDLILALKNETVIEKSKTPWYRRIISG
jgi:hypothetical protein